MLNNCNFFQEYCRTFYVVDNTVYILLVQTELTWQNKNTHTTVKFPIVSKAYYRSLVS